MKLEPDTLAPHAHLFTVRVWLEDLGEGQHEWRGKVQDVTSGEARYFRKWSALRAFLLDMLPTFNDEQRPTDLGEQMGLAHNAEDAGPCEGQH